MKAIKSLLLTLLALTVTGCYTQLQYTSKMKRITDREDASGYTQQTESQPQKEQAEETTDTAYETSQAEVPIYYKDYSYADRWDDCACNPYTINNFYGYNYYDPFLTLNPSYFYQWHPYRYYRYPRPYWGSGFNLSISFGWGWNNFYDPYYYDPFYYDYYWGGYYSPFAFNYYRFYGNSYYGHHGYYDYHGGSSKSNVRYGPRTIGTNRVGDQTGTRSRDANAVSQRNSTTTNNTTVRTRTIGTTRTSNRSSSGTTVTRSRSTTTTSTPRRSRSRSTVQQNNTRQRQAPANRSRGNVRNNEQQSHSAIIRSRTSLNHNPVRIENSSEIRSRLRNQRVASPSSNVMERIKRNRPTFFQRLSGFIENTGQAIGNSARNTGHIRYRGSSSSSGHRSNISRSSGSSSHRSTVTRSRSSSSSSHSRSRGSSSRSRSGSSSSSGSSRSRGHHN